MVPPMLDKFHKGLSHQPHQSEQFQSHKNKNAGQLGRVAVIGGSEDYTGAPYFSAMASAQLGCDMSHIICTPGAASVIKTYSPNLMVHPLMRQLPESPPADGTVPRDADAIASKIEDEMLSRIHVLVVGPGLGRDELMLDTATRVIKKARERKIAVVVDADALAIVGKTPEVVKGYEAAVLTPNVVEFGRLCKELGVEDGEAQVERLAKKLGGVTVVQKGGKDVVSNGESTLVSDLQGGKKRCGGQGDTLTGSVATLLAWRRAYMDRLWEDEEGERLQDGEIVRLAAFGGSIITRVSLS